MEEILRMQDITKSFPGVLALNRAQLSVGRGEIMALLGENGAGKSTLMNVLMGVHRPDSGTISIHGKQVEIRNPRMAIDCGVGIVPQELNVVTELTVAENVFIGMQNRIGKVLFDRKTSNRMAQEILRSLGVELDVNKKVGSYNMAMRQMVQIARTLAFGADIIIFDEPTSVLTAKETDKLLNVMRTLREAGKGIIFITHRLNEVFDVADRATIMRDGCYIETVDIASTDKDYLIRQMVGREVKSQRISRNFHSDDVHLKVEHLTLKGKFEDVSFDVKRGEILGFGGLVGAGRTEVMMALFGYTPADSGKIYVNGEELRARNVRRAIAGGLGYLPEERRAQGIFGVLSVWENAMVCCYSRYSKSGVLRPKQLKQVTEKYIKRFAVKTAGTEKAIKDLSGGNQQKVILSRWIEKDQDILILDEPTRGIDVMAKGEIHALIRELADQGKTIILISSEMEELINNSDRIVIMNEGHVKSIVNADEVDQQTIMSLALN